MTPREAEEYTALRATIRERGTVRVSVVLAGLLGWAALTMAAAGLAAPPVATFMPLLVLSATFEIALALHVGVERIGRYIQVFFEDDRSDPGWEHRIMTFAAATPANDPLFAVHFWIAALFNLIPAMLVGPVPVEWIVVGAGHVLFMLRIVHARRQAAGQRAHELEEFRRLKQRSA
jgi:hypothetical protein